MRHARGFTLIEVLLATVLLGAVLLLVTWLSRFMDVEQALRK